MARLQLHKREGNNFRERRSDKEFCDANSVEIRSYVTQISRLLNLVQSTRYQIVFTILENGKYILKIENDKYNLISGCFNKIPKIFFCVYEHADKSTSDSCWIRPESYCICVQYFPIDFDPNDIPFDTKW